MVEDIVAFLKGRMAEVMVERLFGNSNYHVRNFGAPWKFVTLPILRGEEKPPRLSHDGSPYDRTDEPDYVIYPKGKVQEPKEFIEVKYRADGFLLNKKDAIIKDHCKFWSKELRLSVIVVDSDERPYFTVLQAPYVDEGDRFLDRVPLMDVGWELDAKLYAQYEQLIENGIFEKVRL